MAHIDKILIAEIVKEYKDTIESKSNDAMTIKNRNKAWKDI